MDTSLGADRDEAAIAQLTWAFRSLEERAIRGQPLPGALTFFLGGLDRTLDVEERAYAAMVFACHKQARDELTMMLARRFVLKRGEVVAGMSEHLQATIVAGCARGQVADYLRALRTRVLVKVARFL